MRNSILLHSHRLGILVCSLHRTLIEQAHVLHRIVEERVPGQLILELFLTLLIIVRGIFRQVAVVLDHLDTLLTHDTLVSAALACELLPELSGQRYRLDIVVEHELDLSSLVGLPF